MNYIMEYFTLPKTRQERKSMGKYYCKTKAVYNNKAIRIQEKLRERSKPDYTSQKVCTNE